MSALVTERLMLLDLAYLLGWEDRLPEMSAVWDEAANKHLVTVSANGREASFHYDVHDIMLPMSQFRQRYLQPVAQALAG